MKNIIDEVATLRKKFIQVPLRFRFEVFFDKKNKEKQSIRQDG